jgi:hypothetical protein
VLNGDLGDVIPLMFGDSGFDPATFDIEKQQAAIHRTPFAAEYEANSTDLSKFFNRGGKLLLGMVSTTLGHRPSPLSITTSAR